MSEQEVWKPIPGFSAYEVSSLGRVNRVKAVGRRKPPYMLQGCLNGNGYRLVHLRDENLKPHKVQITKVVAQVFLPNPEHHPCVRVKNGNKDDARAENLYWSPVMSGENNAAAKFSDADIKQIRENYTGAYGEKKALAEKYGTTTSNMCAIINGKTWKHI